jgi:hypothetical protein
MTNYTTLLVNVLKLLQGVTISNLSHSIRALFIENIGELF